MRTKMNANIIRTIALTLCLVLGSVCVNISAQQENTTTQKYEIPTTAELQLRTLYGGIYYDLNIFISKQEYLAQAIEFNDTTTIKEAIKQGAMLNLRTTIARELNILPGFYAIERGIIEFTIEIDTEDKILENEFPYPGYYEKLAKQKQAKTKDMVPYSYKHYRKREREDNILITRKDLEDIDISTLKFLVEGFTVKEHLLSERFVKLDVNQEVLCWGIMRDMLTFAILQDNIPAVEYLNNLEIVNINDRTEKGIPKLFHVQSLEMLQFLTEEQNADIFAETEGGVNFVNYLLTQIRTLDYDENKILSLVGYLLENGVPLLEFYVNPLASAIKSQNPLILEAIVEILESYDAEWLLCRYLSQPDKDGKNLITHLIENIDIYENYDENMTIEIEGTEYNILDYILYLLKKYDSQCQACGMNLLPLSQYKDENGQPAIYKLKPRQRKVFILDRLTKLTDNSDSTPATIEKEVLFDLNPFENQEISLLEKDEDGRTYLDYISDMLYESSYTDLIYLDNTEKYFDTLFIKTIKEISNISNPYKKTNVDLDKKLVEALERNDFIDFVQLTIAGANVNQVDEYGVPLIKKALQEKNTALALYIAMHPDFDNTIQTSNDYYPIDWAVYYPNNIVFEALHKQGSEITYKTKQRAKKRLKKYEEEFAKKIANQNAELFEVKNRSILTYITDLEKEAEEKSETKKEVMSDVQKIFLNVRSDFPF